MRLLTHNFLICTVKDCVQSIGLQAEEGMEEDTTTNYPLQIVLSEGGLAEREEEMNPNFIKNIMKKIDWDAFYQGATSIGLQVPQEKPTDLDNEEILRGIHHALNEVDIIKAKLVCPHCHREYPIEEGIPNMLLNEDEV